MASPPRSSKKERAGHTLQPTALVSELFFKPRGLETRILGEEHLFRIAAGAMQQVLIDSARAKAAGKRIPPRLVSELLPGLDGTGGDPELRVTLKMPWHASAPSIAGPPKPCGCVP